MKSLLHSWNLSLEEARLMQEKLRERLRFPFKKAHFRWVAGADIAYDKRSNRLIAAVLLFDAQDMTVVEVSHSEMEARFPYVPGFLSFREAPSLLDCLDRLERKPEVLMIDGQGIAHPRRFGLACHVGLWQEIPTIGCAKSRLIGQYQEPGRETGSCSDLYDGKEKIGVVLRTKKGVKPLFISQGYLVALPLCVQLVQSCCRGYRLPEPTRQAHLLVTRLRKRLSSPSLP